MSGVDWVIVAFTALLALYGYAQGFMVGVLSLAGFALGAFVGTRLAPVVLASGAHSRYAPVFGLLGALVGGAVLAMGFEGLGTRMRAGLRFARLRLIDGLMGAALTACVALGVVWIGGAVAVQSAGSVALRRDIQDSAILAELNRVLPPSGPILHALARFDPLPSVRGPAAEVPAPTTGVLATAGVRAARSSVVKVVGSACGLGIEGSGWVAGPGIVVTNAHVVAGERDTHVQPIGVPPGLPAHALVFDARNDIAVLGVPGLDKPALRLAPDAPPGRPVAILGYPLDGPFDAEAARLGQTEKVDTEDAYGNGPVERVITTLRGRVRPGNSGGPLVDTRGEVEATVFAAIVSTARHGGFAVPNAIVAQELRHARAGHGAVGTGPCAGA